MTPPLPRAIRTGWYLVFSFVATLALGAHSAEAQELRLIQAVKQRDIPAASKLIQQVDVNATAPDGATALHWAAHWDLIDVAETLLAAGAEPTRANDYGVAPLFLAATNGSAAMVELLLGAGAGANAALPTGETALMTAARSGSAATVSALLADGADVNAAQKSMGQTALMWAVSEGHVDGVSELLDSGADVHAKTLGGFTAILFAARTGNTDVARRLLERGANVNDADTEGSTPILVATVRGHVDLGLFFLEHGADPDGDAETIGYTPLHWASTKSETVITNDYPEAPGEWAALAGIPDRAGKAALIRALVAHGAEINARVTKDLPRYGFGLFKRNHLPGGTPFYLASMVADLEVMRLLLEMGADPSLKGEGDETALMVAAGLTHMDNESRVPEEDRLDAVKLLVELGAELQPVNNNGYNVIHAAAWAGLDSVIEYLSGLGADINLPNEGGQTPLGIAEGNTIGGFFSDRPSTAVLLRRLGAASEGAVTLDRTIEQQNDRRERQGTNSSGALSDEEPQP